MTTAEIPEVMASLDSRGRLVFFCIYCRTKHYHGAGYGHRQAHCEKPNSPYRKTGYYLVPNTEAARA